RPRDQRIRDRGTPALPADPAREAGASHQPLHPAATHWGAFAMQRSPDLARAVDAEVLGVQPPDLTQYLLVAQRTRRRLPRPRGVVRRWGELQRRADRLDPETIAVLVDERDYFLCWRSSSAPKKVAADLRISFARRSSAFSFSRLRIRALSSLVTPGASPL